MALGMQGLGFLVPPIPVSLLASQGSGSGVAKFVFGGCIFLLRCSWAVP